ncbi:YusW family protein [Halalkalibacter krulwichiae]|uniref:YusW-like protein n=1 Tax=Halalkalibacter krulwichiae TaxID=199441 RepID=A0A1X9MET0_9BACI|nr:YusW family protein [Halalkalibacter krulwichiae]ARK31955.1 hypothetical protein BkAM31D_20085 [Halalkalibacter krulwichiae]
MKKWFLLLFVFTVVGCGQNNATEEPLTDGADQAETEDPITTDEGTAEATYFTDFDLDVEYANDQSVEVDYDYEGQRDEAEVDNELTGESLRGDEALAYVYSTFEQLTIDPQTDDETVIRDILNVFNLEDNYEDFELEVTFLDGTKKEYKSRQGTT